MFDSSNARRQWIGVLALSPTEALETACDALADKPEHRLLRRPEVGLAMLRGRIGGSGEPFNLGEATMTRAAVQIRCRDGSVATGHGHVLGRDPRHAELAALFDALLQDSGRRQLLLDAVIAPLAASLEARRAAEAARVAPSKVEFFTLVRGG